MAQTKEGAIKVAAKKAGLSLNEYIDRITKGLKKCTICKTWKELNQFTPDKSRHDGLSAKCDNCSKVIWRKKSMTSNQRKDRIDGDKQQARQRINADIVLGLRPNPNKLYCSLCGHMGDDKRHEYHHIMGYGKEHHYDVLPLCSQCHHGEHANAENQD